MNLQTLAPARSLGLKLILVGALAFLLWLPAMLVYALVWERSTRAEQVKAEIHDLQGGRQAVSGPIIVVPAIIDAGKADKNGAPVTRLTAVTFTPRTLDIDADVKTSTRRRSIYDAVVYDADIVMRGRFGPLIAPKTSEGALTILWEQAALAIKFADEQGLKGVRGGFRINLNGALADLAFEPGIDILRNLAADSGEYAFYSSGISAPLAGRLDPEGGFDFELTLPLSGGGALFFSPVGEATSVALSADWPDPSFQGAYLPDERSVADTGFTAGWRISYLARNLPRSFVTGSNLAILDEGKSFGAEFATTASPYKSVNRALKYALMFLGLIFLTFFLFEAVFGTRAHPAQYILLGMTQVLFYLLVLAFSEHVGFERAFIGTAGATVLLSGFYAATVFRSFWRGLIALAAFSGAYMLIYLLMKSEDYALLIGSVTAFAAIALTMFVTRDLDWYGESASKERTGSHGPAHPSEEFKDQRQGQDT